MEARKPTSLKKACKNFLEVVAERKAAGGVATVGIPTGLAELDVQLGGWRRSAVYVIAGRPGMGKSSLALWSLIHAAMNGEHVMLASFEMNAEMIALRALSGLTGIPGYNIERGILSSDEMDRLNGVLPLVEGMKFTILDQPMTSRELADGVKKYAETDNAFTLVAADYASLFRDSGGFGENERLGQVSGNLLALSHEIEIPILLLAQLNRQTESREGHIPQLSDIRDSGSLEQDAFSVLFAYRAAYYAAFEEEDYQPKDVEYDAKIIIAKNRQGSTGVVTVAFHPKTMRWTDSNPEIVLPPSVKGRVKR